MPVDNGEAGGDYLDRDFWMERGAEGALVAFRIKRIEDPVNLVPGSKMEKAMPVVCDVVFLNGEFEGVVYRDERIIPKGMVTTLREKTVRVNGKAIKVPRERGTNVAVRMGTYEGFGREHPKAHPCGPDELAKVQQVFTDTDDDPYSFYERKALEGLAQDALPVDTAPAEKAEPASSLPF